MRDLYFKKERFINLSNNYSLLYSYSNRREQLVYTAGVLNFIWNGWNNLWREIWIAHVSGGVDFHRVNITPLFPKYNDKEACHFLLHACGKKKHHNPGDAILGAYQEATWGDPKIIAKIATHLTGHHSHMNYLLGILGLYSTNIEHFQMIRNSFIHLNSEKIYDLNALVGYYSFEPNQKIIDILESTDIASANRCFDNLLNSMKGMLLNL